MILVKVRSGLVAWVFVAVLVLTVGAERAMAQFVLTSEQRAISANASVLGSSDEVDTDGAYNNTVSDFGNPGDATGDSTTNTASASQNSDLSTAEFGGTGSATSAALISGIIFDSVSSNASSSYQVTFTVPVATDIQLSGELDSIGNGTASVSFDAFLASAGPANPTQPFSFSETLMPGTSYVLGVSGASASAAEIDGNDFESDTEGGTGSFSFSFAAVPEPATAVLLLMATPALLTRSHRRN
jgi:hypothetical protein